tara:strand:+ start:482 stop:721 length:240 start_codon:yes stop_codon:yes gene_type:complete
MGKKDKWPNVRIMDPVHLKPLTVEQLQNIPSYGDLKMIERSGIAVPDSTTQRAVRIWQWQQKNMSKREIQKIQEQNTNK